MARRRRTSPAEDLMDLVAMLPWWAGIALALISYLLLHRVATQPVLAAVRPGQLGAMLTQSLWVSLASFGQYVVPLICMAGAALSAWRRRERRSLVAEVVHSKAADVLDGMTWQQFEKLVGEGFRLQGYRVAETGGGGADGGVDLVLTRGGEKFLVQCKQWRAFKVGVDVVRELYGVMAARGATGGFIVTSGRYTADAEAFASGRNVTLVDGIKLQGLIRQAQAGGAPSRAVPGGPAPATPPSRPPPPSAAETPAAAAPVQAAGVASATAPACPVCAQPMVGRTAKRGPKAGGAFWGCTGYPACRGARPIG